MTRILLALILKVSAVAVTAGEGTALIGESQQLIVVISEDWKSVGATLSLLERDTLKSPWKRGESWPVVLGRNGMGWGIGLHGGSPAKAEHVKVEGDGCAPAGIFDLLEAFGKRPVKLSRFPYRQLSQTLRGVDDPKSRHYNRIVDLTKIEKPDWQSAEIMWREDSLYDWGIVVAHNWKPHPGKGSCIFMHTWRGPKTGTAGCTAMPEKRMISLVNWLDRSKRPRLVQFPRRAYEALEARWQLPVLPAR